MRKHILAIVLAQMSISNPLFSMDIADIPQITTAEPVLNTKLFEEIEIRFHKGEKEQVRDALILFFQQGNLYAVPYLKELSNIIEDSELKSSIASYPTTQHASTNFRQMGILYNPSISKSKQKEKIENYKKNIGSNIIEVLAHYGKNKSISKMILYSYVNKDFDRAIFWGEHLERVTSQTPDSSLDWGTLYWHLYLSYVKTGEHAKSQDALHKSAKFDNESAVVQILDDYKKENSDISKHPLCRSSKFIKRGSPELAVLSKIKFPDTDEQYQEGIDELSQLPSNKIASVYFKLGEYFYLENNLEKATYFLKPAAQRIDFLEANQKINILTWEIQNKLDLSRDYNEIFARLIQLDKELTNNHTVNLLLGYCYTKGLGTNVDYQKEYQAYSKSLNEQGFCDGDSLDEKIIMGNLAMLYQTGQGVPQDDQRAEALRRKAIANGGPDSISYSLAFKLYFTTDEKKDIKEAIRLLLPIAENFPQAQTTLGYIYQELADIQRSLYRFRRAVENGDLNARYELIMLSIDRPDLVTEIPNAIAALYENIKKGHEYSRFSLAHLLSLEDGDQLQEIKSLIEPLFQHAQYAESARLFMEKIENPKEITITFKEPSPKEETLEKSEPSPEIFTKQQKKEKKRQKAASSIQLHLEKNTHQDEEKQPSSCITLAPKQRANLEHYAKQYTPMKKQDFVEFLKTIKRSTLDAQQVSTKSGSTLFTEYGKMGWHYPHKNANMMPNGILPEVRALATNILDHAKAGG